MERITRNKKIYYALMTLIVLAILYMFMRIWPLFTSFFIFLKAVLAPFLIALIISYMLNPIVNLLNRRNVPRPLAVLLIYAVFLFSVTIILMRTIPALILQLKDLGEHLPSMTAHMQQWMDGYNDHKYALPEMVRTGIERSLNKMEAHVSNAISSFLNGIGSTINTLFVAFIVPFLAFYMLKDFKLMEKTVIALVPRVHRKETIKLLKNVDEALGNYIRGQLIVCFIIGILAYIGYWIIGMSYPLLLAFFVAIMNIIPYLGPFFGAAPALLLASTVSLKMVMYVALVNFIIQLLEGNVVSPQIVGRTLHIHPLSIILSLLVGGEIAGITGLILAVPVFAVLKVIVHHVFLHYVRR